MVVSWPATTRPMTSATSCGSVIEPSSAAAASRLLTRSSPGSARRWAITSVPKAENSAIAAPIASAP